MRLLQVPRRRGEIEAFPATLANDTPLQHPVAIAPVDLHINQSNAIPSLDGIRAISVLIVVLGHSGLGSVVPGGLGVTIFFFLSGYLISTLMLADCERTGKINILHFMLAVSSG